MQVVEASPKDFDEVYGLLKQLNNTTISRDTWQKTFESPFAHGTPPGFLLKDGDKTVGFFGTIYSKRIIDGREVKFCNCHSWIVDEKYRSRGLLLLNKIHKLQGHVLTIFSASDETHGIYKQLKWEMVDNEHSIFFANPVARLFSDPKNVLKGKEMWRQLDDAEKQIAEGHQAFRCSLNLLQATEGHSFQVFKEVGYFPARLARFSRLIPGKFQLGQLYYASNPDLFFSGFGQNLLAVCKREKWTGVVVPNRMLGKMGISPGRRYYKRRPVLVKNARELDSAQIDLLYSEIFILDLN